MPSSTFSSEDTLSIRRRAEAGRFIALTLTLLLLAYVAVELSAKFGFTRISRIQRRMDNEYRETLTIKPTEHGRPSVLLAGNSLLLEGVDLEQVKQNLGQSFSVHRYTIEQTEYFDWYFGLRRLYREGARPAHVVLFMNTLHLTGNEIRGDYFGYFMLDRQDAIEAAKAAHLDLTATSDLLIATESPWFGARSEIRNWMIEKVDPSFHILVNNLLPTAPADESTGATAQIAGERLAALKFLCAQYGSQFIFVIPPALRNKDAALVQRTSAAHGVPTLVPFPVLPDSDFRDGFHLNSVGSRLFTARLDADLLKTLF